MKDRIILMFSFILIILSILTSLFLLPDLMFKDMILYVIMICITFMLSAFIIKEVNKAKYKGTIFLSYMPEDKVSVDFFRNKLESVGYRCYPDLKRFELGCDIYEDVDKELEKSSTIIVFISRYSIRSKYFSYTIREMKKKKRRILPIVLEDSVEIPTSLRNKVLVFYNLGKEKVLYKILLALA